MDQSSFHNVLVTGGTGFVGSHLVERLIKEGHSVTCLVRDPAQLKWLAGLPVNIVQGDCSRPDTLEAAVTNISQVFHVAGLTKARHIADYYTVNHLGTRNILEACTRYNPGLRKFILVSSLAAAGPSPNGRLLTDRDAPRPITDYGRSKLLAEEETVACKDRFPVVMVRPSAVYGPRDKDMFELFRWAVRGLTLEVAGGERFINPCYVMDLVQALYLAATKDTASGSIYFIAEDKPYSWSEFREALLSAGNVKARNLKVPLAVAYLIGLLSELGGMVTGKPALTNRQKIREAVQKYWLCDLTKTQRELGFRHAYPLQKGLELTWHWYREQGWL